MEECWNFLQQAFLKWEHLYAHVLAIKNEKYVLLKL